MVSAARRGESVWLTPADRLPDCQFCIADNLTHWMKIVGISLPMGHGFSWHSPFAISVLPCYPSLWRDDNNLQAINLHPEVTLTVSWSLRVQTLTSKQQLPLLFLLVILIPGPTSSHTKQTFNLFCKLDKKKTLAGNISESEMLHHYINIFLPKMLFLWVYWSSYSRRLHLQAVASNFLKNLGIKMF